MGTSRRRSRPLSAYRGVSEIQGYLDKPDWHVTSRNDTLLIYERAKWQQHAEDGAAAAPVPVGATAPMACFKAPESIRIVRWRGAAICVGCSDGVVHFLSAPFLTA